ncbi:TPA: hypothetical protein DIV45_01365 [Patescibacteria group bacterium]|uniref:Major facilitator superfamily (MFS) profile domain-containing protein n=1 Tax=Candidatus Woykebacteria bacterium GWA1_44_8 TaxID=1802591 RepID=A0A1G1W4W0_9BACT|nr:MAG: hypothetical protein A2113_00455 [Candidatus Woykebacteria bacterium GWA1_44_8]HCR41997.1 hypothetical protein [Patescibacteria group bacterium]
MLALKDWQKRILFTSWITYAGFYLTRVNISVAIPGMIQEFGISKTVMGAVLSALFFAYAAGQFINGQMGDKFGSKKLVAVGLLGTAIINVIFGFTGNFLAGMILLWALNGFFQSMGWAPTVKLVANWFPSQDRGRAAGILGTSYQIGNVLSLALAGVVVGALGWRWAFWAPVGIMVLLSIHWLWRVQEKAEDVGLKPVEIATPATGFRSTLRYVLTSRYIWLVALSLFGLNIVRYGFLDWAPTYFFEVQKAHIATAAYKSIIFPLAGSIGALSAGWLSDRFCQSRRAPVSVILLVILVAAILIFPHWPAELWWAGLINLAVIGFATYGPHVLMVAALPMDLGTKEMAASATGFIDGWGYIGAALTGVGTGYLLDRFGWNSAFDFWVAGAVVAAALIACMWNYKPVCPAPVTSIEGDPAV